MKAPDRLTSTLLPNSSAGLFSQGLLSLQIRWLSRTSPPARIGLPELLTRLRLSCSIAPVANAILAIASSFLPPLRSWLVGSK